MEEHVTKSTVVEAKTYRGYVILVLELEDSGDTSAGDFVALGARRCLGITSDNFHTVHKKDSFSVDTCVLPTSKAAMLEARNKIDDHYRSGLLNEQN